MEDGRATPSGATAHGPRVAVRIGPDGARRVDVRDLLAGAREVLIDHAGQVYRLRLTASGKLILTK